MRALLCVAGVSVLVGAWLQPGATVAAISPLPTSTPVPSAGGLPVSPHPPVTVAIDTQAPGPPVPQRFLGLSFEAAAIDQLARYAHHGDLVAMLRSLGPGLLRFGGITADHNVAWTDALTPRPAWASSTIGPAQLRAIGELARHSGWRVLLTVGMAHDEPLAAAREVAAAHAALGPRLAAVEIGNEPDAYGRHGLRALPWLAQGYEEEVTSYREAIAVLTPNVPIAGPDVTGPGVFGEWGEEEVLAQHPAMLTGHHYPLGCAQVPAPSIEALLSAHTREREARSLATYLMVSRSSGIPLRIDETGSVSCGGVAGISNTFASALWATAYVTQAMAAGLAGINLESNPVSCGGYTPLCAGNPTALADGALHAQPAWYALLLTRSLVGRQPLPVAVTSASEGSPNLVVAAFSGPARSLQLVLLDAEAAGASPLRLQLSVGAGMGPARVLRLTAPSPSATSGTLLGGRGVSAGGSWQPPPRLETAAPRAGILTLAMPASSGALVTIGPRVAAHGPRRPAHPPRSPGRR